MTEKKRRAVKRPTRKRAETRAAEDQDVGSAFEIRATAPILWRVLFARDENVPLEPKKQSHVVQSQMHLWRAHRRHLAVELSVAVSNVPWLQEQTMVVSYRIEYTIRGRVTDEFVEGAITDLGRGIAPATVYPFIRETVMGVTGKTGRPFLLPMVDWAEEFGNAEIPSTDVEPPPELLTPVEA